MDLNEELDIFGQQTGLSNLYTQITSCYAVPDEASYSGIIETLKTGLERLSKGFPWVAGQVVNEESSRQGNTGVFKIKYLEQSPRLVVKDLRDDLSISTRCLISYISSLGIFQPSLGIASIPGAEKAICH